MSVTSVLLIFDNFYVFSGDKKFSDFLIDLTSRQCHKTFRIDIHRYINTN